MRIIREVVCCFVALMLLTGCGLLPRPSYSTNVEIDPSYLNGELTDQIVEILARNRVIRCGPGKLPRCFPPNYRSEPVEIDKAAATITIGNYDDGSLVGHTSRISRQSGSEIDVTVKGWGPYYSELPNEDVALHIAHILRGGLSRESPYKPSYQYGIGAYLPTPAYSAQIYIDKTISNEELTASIRSILESEGIAPCDPDDPSSHHIILGCDPITWPVHKIKTTSHSSALVVIGDDNPRRKDKAGRRVRFSRYYRGILFITTSGDSEWGRALDNGYFGRVLADVIRQGLVVTQ